MSRPDGMNRRPGRRGRSTTGLPETTPFSMASTMPFFHGRDMYWRGMAPPTILSTNSNPPPRGMGSISIQVSPNWPRPPVCFLYRPWILGLALDSFLVRNLGRLQFHVHAVLALDLFQGRLDMDLTHAGKNGFTGLTAALQAQGNVFVQHFGQGRKNLFLVALDLGGDGRRK